jgi:hypothetical protein
LPQLWQALSRVGFWLPAAPPWAPPRALPSAVEKLFRCIPEKYKQIARSIESLLDLSTMSIEEAIGRLKVTDGDEPQPLGAYHRRWKVTSPSGTVRDLPYKRMSSIGILSMRILVQSPTLNGLDFPLTTLVGIIGKRKQFLTCTQKTIRAKIERLRSARLIKDDQKITSGHAEV